MQSESNSSTYICARPKFKAMKRNELIRAPMDRIRVPQYNFCQLLHLGRDGLLVHAELKTHHDLVIVEQSLPPLV